MRPSKKKRASLILQDPSASHPPTSRPADAGTPQEQIARLLGATQPDVPYLFPRSDESRPQALTREILTAEQTQLCIYAPNETPETAWIAVKLQGGKLALLASLPRTCPTEQP
ncbi:MAG: hypothetical protein IJW12_03230 [Opitutales bacterium]|nr:hypothetical protein [Opitutales bacterium]